MQSSKLALLVVFVTVVVAGTASAVVDVVAIKRSAGLSVTAGLDQSFQDAIGAGTLAVHTDASSGQDLVDDAWLYKLTSGNAPYYNYGTSPGSLAGTNNVVHLTRFELSELPGFTGGQVVKAQLRYYLGIVGQAAKLEYQGGGNTGGYVTTGPWSEGTQNGYFPGAAGGVTYNNPNGVNTGQSGPLGWANNTYFGPAKDGVQMTMPRVTADYTGALVASDTDGFIAFDVTAIVQLWANGTANYGFFIPQAQNTPLLKLSEIAATLGSEFQPTLFIAYTPEPTMVCLLATGLAGLVLRRRY